MTEISTNDPHSSPGNWCIISRNGRNGCGRRLNKEPKESRWGEGIWHSPLGSIFWASNLQIFLSLLNEGTSTHLVVQARNFKTIPSLFLSIQPIIKCYPFYFLDRLQIYILYIHWHHPVSGLLNLRTTDIWGQIFLFCWGILVHYRMFWQNSRLLPTRCQLQHPPPILLGCDNQRYPKHCQISPGLQNSTLPIENHCLIPSYHHVLPSILQKPPNRCPSPSYYCTQAHNPLFIL